MKKIGKEIQERMDALKWGQGDLVREITRHTGATIHRPTISLITTGKSTPRSSTLELILKTLDAGEREKNGGLPGGQYHDPLQAAHEESYGAIPVIGPTAAGHGFDFELNPAATDRNVPGSLYHAPEEGPAVIVATGDSMQPLIKNGDLVVIARRFWRAPQTDDIVAVSFTQDRGSTIKHLEILADGRWLLKPQNAHDHPTRIVEASDIRAAAVVVGWYHPVHRPQKTVANKRK